MNKILFFTESDHWGKKIQENGVHALPLFKKLPFLLKAFRILHFKYNLPYKSVWYSDWKNKLVDFNIIILSASEFTPPIAKFIDNKQLKNGIRFIYWYWDPIRLKYAPNLISDQWEKWSFDKDDCRNYGLKYNSTYFFNSIKLPREELFYDVFFIGQDKGRLKELLFLKDKLENSSLKVLFHIVSDKKIFIDEKVYNARISYSEVLMYISKSKSILEFVQENQSGPTLRSMEALFFNKKLITNNSSIKDYNLYNKENIFILGEDDINNIKEFIEMPYKILDQRLIDQYDFKEWIERIINDIELN